MEGTIICPYCEGFGCVECGSSGEEIPATMEEVERGNLVPLPDVEWDEV